MRQALPVRPATLSRGFLLPVAALCALLTACGGGDDDAATAAAAGGTLTLSAATPAAQATTIDLSTATTKGTNARPADGFSSVPYCEVFWENATGANGKKYAVQVYFRQDNKQPMHASVFEVTSGWSVYENNNGATITGITVDTTARTLVFNSKALAGLGTDAATVTGTTGFQASTTAACGA
jgi:hypothetical protein